MSQSRIKVRAAGLLVKDGRLLLVEHRKGKERYWVLPGGGVEFGESAARCLEREFREELGLRIRTGRFLFCDEVRLKKKSGHNIDLYFSCRLAGGSRVRLEKDSCVSGYGFFGRRELPKLRIRPPLNAILASCLSKPMAGTVFPGFR